MFLNLSKEQKKKNGEFEKFRSQNATRGSYFLHDMCIIDVSSSGNRRINYYGVKARLGVRAVEEVKGALLT